MNTTKPTPISRKEAMEAIQQYAIDEVGYADAPLPEDSIASMLATALQLIEEMKGALEAMDKMYTKAWDCTDGSLHFSANGVKQFEKNHRRTEKALNRCKELIHE